MQTPYHVERDDHFQEKITSLLQEQDEIAIFIPSIPQFKFIANKVTGEVYPVSTEEIKTSENNAIQNSYSSKLFPDIIEAITESLSLVVKMDLLAQLEKIEDSGIQTIISEHHRAANGEKKNMNLAAIDKTLQEIERGKLHTTSRLFDKAKKTPTQEKVAAALQPFKTRATVFGAMIGMTQLYTITSTKEVMRIMDKIKTPSAAFSKNNPAAMSHR